MSIRRSHNFPACFAQLQRAKKSLLLIAVYRWRAFRPQLKKGRNVNWVTWPARFGSPTISTLHCRVNSWDSLRAVKPKSQSAPLNVPADSHEISSRYERAVKGAIGR